MRERIYSDGMMNIQTRVFNFQCFSLRYSITPFWNFWGPQNRRGIFWGLIFGPGIFLGFAGSPRDFLGSWLLAPFDHPRHLKCRVPPLGWNYRKKIGFPVCKKGNFAGLQAHRERGKSPRGSPTPHHTLKWGAERSFHRPTFIRPDSEPLLPPKLFPLLYSSKGACSDYCKNQFFV